MVSFHNAKHVPRSASTNVTRGAHRLFAEPLSYISTGTPVYVKCQSFFDLTPAAWYKFAIELLT